MLRQDDPSAAYDRAWWNNWLLKLIYRGFRAASVWWVRAILAVRQIKLPSTSVPDTTIPFRVLHAGLVYTGVPPM